MERFMSILIEHTAGKFPLWLTPDRAESIGRKIRDTEVNKIPLMMIVGDKEAESNTLSVRKQGDGDVGSMSIDEFVAYFQGLVEAE